MNLISLRIRTFTRPLHHPARILRAFAFMGILTALSSTCMAQNEPPKPIWELAAGSIDPQLTKGTVELVDGVVKFDGTNALSLPASLIGDKKDYTIEFEVKRPPETVPDRRIHLVSNFDGEKKTGFGIIYCPPEYNAALIFLNGYQTAEHRGFLNDAFNKVTIVVKDRKLSFFKNGLILTMTEECKPSDLPLTFGGIERNPAGSYEFKNIKIYNEAVFPTGFDQSAERMRNYSGEGYFMQRVEIKDPTLPRILVVGDSISMGYRSFITEHFKGRAYVDYWVGGGWFGETAKGPDSPAKRVWNGVLSNGPYDVISWNAMTLHMWNGYPGRCDEKTYPANMTEVVEHLQKTAPNTRIIWVRCTPWRTTPDTGHPTYDTTRNDAIVRLNKVTDTIMTGHGIPEVDLYALAEKRFDTVPAGSKDALHWSTEVSREMAGEIIKEIEKDFPKTHLAK